MCECVSKVNKTLEPKGLEVDQRVTFTMTDPPIITLRIPICLAPESRARRTKAPVVFAQFCPFCGEAVDQTPYVDAENEPVAVKGEAG